MYNIYHLSALLAFTTSNSRIHAFAPTGRLVSHRLVTQNNLNSVGVVNKSNLVRFATPDVSTKEVDVPEPEQKSLLQKVCP